MNKQAYRLAAAGVGSDYGRTAVKQMLESYVKFLDFDSVLTTADAIIGDGGVTSGFAPSATLDMNDYMLATSQANTKNDTINSHILNLNADLQRKCDKGMTALLVDTEASIVLGNSDRFTANATFASALDGLIGSYNTIPVIRHHGLDGYVQSEADGRIPGVVIALYKDPNGLKN